MHVFLRFLDDLTDWVALQMPRLFLAPEARVSNELTRLRQLLIEQVGVELETFAEHGLSGATARQDVR